MVVVAFKIYLQIQVTFFLFIREKAEKENTPSKRKKAEKSTNTEILKLSGEFFTSKIMDGWMLLCVVLKKNKKILDFFFRI